VPEVKESLLIGVVGLGARGLEAVRRLSTIPGARVAAVCDSDRTRAAAVAAERAAAGAPPNVFSGPEGWRALCAEADLDLVYVTAPWLMHVPVALAAMASGKHVAVEVPAALTVEDCWALVEASRKSSRACVQLENCCYGEIELLAKNLADMGMLGTLVHAEGGYVHRLFGPGCPPDEMWRAEWNMSHRGNQYATHALGPICMMLGIGVSDRLDHLVSLECAPFDFSGFARENGLEPREGMMGDHNTTLIRTVKGRSILLRHDVASIRHRSRGLHLQGTLGVMNDDPFRIAWTSRENGGAEEWLDPEALKLVREAYRHPLWKMYCERARTVDKHGGMDWLMDFRLVTALREGSKPDTDVYDLAEWCSIAELSERSVDMRGSSVSIPDFRST